MAIVSLNKKALEKKVGKLNEKLKDRINMLGTPIEEETPEDLKVDVFPNRPDLLSEQGLSRALLAFIGKKTGLPNYKVEKSDYKVIIDPSVNDIRPFTACAVVKGLEFDDTKIKELIDMQEKLHTTYGRNRKRIAMGVYPMERIKFPIHYKALSPEKIKFRPLESPKEMTAQQILTRLSTGRDYAYLLEGKKKFPIFTDDSNKILSMPPIINSHETGKVSEQTHEVFIECSGFDLNVLNKCLAIIVTTLSDMGGKIYSVELKYKGKNIKTPNLNPEKTKLSLKSVNKLLGLELKENDVRKLLEKMNFAYSAGIALVPAYRTDILHEADLIEDIAIAYGYENFQEQIPSISTIAKESKIEIFKTKLAESLVGLNISETYSYSLTTFDEECKKMNTKKDLIHLDNSKTHYKDLRATMLPSLMKIFGNNRDVDYPQRIFEMGRVFNKSGKDIKESTTLAIALTNSNFTEVKQVLEYLARMFDLKLEIRESKHDSMIEGRTGKVLINKQEVGIIGEVHPKVLSEFKLLVPVAALELELDKIMK